MSAIVNSGCRAGVIGRNGSTDSLGKILAALLNHTIHFQRIVEGLYGGGGLAKPVPRLFIDHQWQNERLRGKPGYSHVAGSYLAQVEASAAAQPILYLQTNRKYR